MFFLPKLVDGGFTRPKPDYTSFDLTYFDPRILTEYVWELPTYADRCDESLSEIFGVLEMEDLFLAIQYAENVIVPFLRNRLDELTEDQLLEWITEIHKRAANVLAEDEPNAEAGVYVTDTSVQWTLGTQSFAELANALTEKGDSLKQFLEKYQLSSIHDDLIKLFNKLDSDKTFSMVEKNAAFGAFHHHCNKIIYGVHHNKFSSDELALIKKIVIVRMPPEAIPGAMKQYAKEVVARLKSCPNNRGDVAKVAAFAFQGLTKVHPYWNAMGRSAGILSNSILAGFHFKTILMRSPESVTDKNSSYCVAIQHIDDDISHFENHILLRLDEAENLNPKLLDMARQKLAMRKITVDGIYEILSEHSAACLAKKPYPLAEKVTILMASIYEKMAKVLAPKWLEIATNETGWKSSQRNKEVTDYWIEGLTEDNAQGLVDGIRAILETAPKSITISIKIERKKLTSAPIPWIKVSKEDVPYFTSVLDILARSALERNHVAADKNPARVATYT